MQQYTHAAVHALQQYTHAARAVNRIVRTPQLQAQSVVCAYKHTGSQCSQLVISDTSLVTACRTAAQHQYLFLPAGLGQTQKTQQDKQGRITATHPAERSYRWLAKHSSKEGVTGRAIS